MDTKSERTNLNGETAGALPPRFTSVVGKTTYEVTVHFSQTSAETIDDKVKRLIQSDYNNFEN